MLYPTHQKYGILFGIIMIPLSVLMGFLPTVSMHMRPIDICTVLFACFIGMSGALFGARFPDIDSPSSIPARRHPIIRKIFAFFKIKHRGKYSHDYATIGLTFFLLFMIVRIGGERLLHAVALGNTVVNYAVYGIALVLLYLVGNDMIDFLIWAGGKLKQKSMVKMLEAKRLVFVIGLVITSIALLWISGLLSFNALAGGADVTTSLTIATIGFVVLQIYFLFAWAGAYSHLFADMTTKEGVRFFGVRLAPAQVMLKVKKIPAIGPLLVPTDFRTGSDWEDFNAKVITFACVPSALIALFFLFGFNLAWVF